MITEEERGLAEADSGSAGTPASGGIEATRGVVLCQSQVTLEFSFQLPPPPSSSLWSPVSVDG